eukprot:CAMPEP_0117526606 /NCGR_PEP_ID=MMETSP0784-20121206/36370_1 /TAXON_ID=39447 /ORGANISM="" /LENGTH=592 /DNA_ID=CAMNT_0005322835 /DNA_START=24 /DNA_END=1802 /DNA_ORIENTATION=-
MSAHSDGEDEPPSRIAPPPPDLPDETPDLDVPQVTLGIVKLTAAVDWLIVAVKSLEEGQEEFTGSLGNGRTFMELLQQRLQLALSENDELRAKIKELEEAIAAIPPPPEPGFKRFTECDEQDIQDLSNIMIAERFCRTHDLDTFMEKVEKMLDVEGMVGKKEYLQDLQMMRDDIHLCLNVGDFEEHREALEARLAEMDALHDEDVAMREAAERAHKKLVRRVDDIEEGLESLEQRHGERLDYCEVTLKEHGSKFGDIYSRLDGHDSHFEEQERQRKLLMKNKGPVTLESLGHVDLSEEVRRLRSMVECMEQTMGEELRKTMEFFRNQERKGKKGLMPLSDATRQESSGGGSSNAAALRELQSDFEERLIQTQNIAMKDSQHVFTALRNMERENSQLLAKVDDMWCRLPKVIALLEPLKLEAQNWAQREDATSEAKPQSAADAEPSQDSRAEVQVLTGVMRKALHSSLSDLRDDLGQSIADVRKDIGRKADNSELAALSNRLDAWTQHAPGCSQTLRRRGDGSGEEEDGYDSPIPAWSPEGTRGRHRMDRSLNSTDGRGRCHDRCKQPTCPRSLSSSQSLGRLPKLQAATLAQ